MKNVKKFGCYDYSKVISIWNVVSKHASKIENGRAFVPHTNIEELVRHLIKTIKFRYVGYRHIVNCSNETVAEYANCYLVFDMNSCNELVFFEKTIRANNK